MPKLIIDVAPDHLIFLQAEAAKAGRSVEQYARAVILTEAHRELFASGAVTEAKRILPGVLENFTPGTR